MVSLIASVVTMDSFGTHSHRLMRDKHNIKMLEVVFDLFKLDQGRYPTQQEGFEIFRSKGNSDIRNWKQYLKEVPVDSWGNPYLFEVENGNNGEVVKLYSKGPNGVFESGDGDDIVNWEKGYNCEFYKTCRRPSEYIFMVSAILATISLIVILLIAILRVIKYLLKLRNKSTVDLD